MPRTTNVVSQESFSAFDAAWRRELITNCPMPVGGAYPVSTLPGLGGIELNETIVRDHPYQGMGGAIDVGGQRLPRASEGMLSPDDSAASGQSGNSTSGAEETEPAAEGG